MSVNYMVGCDTGQPAATRFCDVFDAWSEARQHLLALFVAYYTDTVPEPIHTFTRPIIEEITSWRSPVFRSVGTNPDAPRFFVYPAVLEGGEHKLACPRCSLNVEATEVHHGVVVGGTATRIDFEQSMPMAYRVYCEGDCGAESDECENLYDAIDAFMFTVTWPRQSLGRLGITALPPIRWCEDEGRWQTSAIVPVATHEDDDDPGYFVLELIEPEDGRTVGYRVNFHPNSVDPPHEGLASGVEPTTTGAKRSAEAALHQLVREAAGDN